MHPQEAERSRRLVTMNHDQLQYAGLLELLIGGPVGGHRRWAAFLVLRMLETRAVCHYREESRLGGWVHAQSAIASLRAAARVLSESEQGLFLRTVLLASWEGQRRAPASASACLRSSTISSAFSVSHLVWLLPDR